MQTIHCTKVRNFLAGVAVLIASLGFATPVFAATFNLGILNPDGKLTYLGTLGGSNFANGMNNGINDVGQAIGSSNTVDHPGDIFSLLEHAFITGPNGVGVTDLGTLGGSYSDALSINAAGQVVGVSSRADSWDHAFITGPNGVGMTDLGTLGGNSSSSATGINAAGQVVGGSYTTDGSLRAFITGPNGVGMTALGTLGGATSFAHGINDAGQVIGESGTVAGDYFPYHAFITGPDGIGMTDLGTLGGSESYALSINAAGQVAGSSRLPAIGDIQGDAHAFITGPNGVGMTDLGTLGGTDSGASGINDAGQVVGGSRTADGLDHAFITGPNGVGMTDLNSLAVNLPDGKSIFTAYGINNHGQILVGINEGQIPVGVVPEPETYAMLLAGLALLGFMTRLRKAAWPAPHPLCNRFGREIFAEAKSIQA